jgi:hypothetical protein
MSTPTPSPMRQGIIEIATELEDTYTLESEDSEVDKKKKNPSIQRTPDEEEQLRKLAEQLEKGLINHQEYNQRKGSFS